MSPTAPNQGVVPAAPHSTIRLVAGRTRGGKKQLTEAWESSASENRESDLPLCVSRRVHRDIIYPMVKWSALAEPLNC